ncbi:hypothetical protein [Couchioplanes caeruleus]|uniref:Uncharacterized protein n=1 Tax=Couchioplanes caeruleus TaxID=56438 RepID=A0A3N1FTF3_9ACTN|nr:hypothetical protein [Couchioplanes caeruleus]ROP21281.1 hypothetical protein EDD30_7678 [Couchioplanes caeruleus]
MSADSERSFDPASLTSKQGFMELLLALGKARLNKTSPTGIAKSAAGANLDNLSEATVKRIFREKKITFETLSSYLTLCSASETERLAITECYKGLYGDAAPDSAPTEPDRPGQAPAAAAESPQPADAPQIPEPATKRETTALPAVEPRASAAKLVPTPTGAPLGVATTSDRHESRSRLHSLNGPVRIAVLLALTTTALLVAGMVMTTPWDRANPVPPPCSAAGCPTGNALPAPGAASSSPATSPSAPPAGPDGGNGSPGTTSDGQTRPGTGTGDDQGGRVEIVGLQPTSPRPTTTSAPQSALEYLTSVTPKSSLNAKVTTCRTVGGAALPNSILFTPTDGKAIWEAVTPADVKTMTFTIGVHDRPGYNASARIGAFVQIGNTVDGVTTKAYSRNSADNPPDPITYGPGDRVTVSVTPGELVRFQITAGDEPDEVCVAQPVLNR